MVTRARNGEIGWEVGVIKGINSKVLWNTLTTLHRPAKGKSVDCRLLVRNIKMHVDCIVQSRHSGASVTQLSLHP